MPVPRTPVDTGYGKPGTRAIVAPPAVVAGTVAIVRGTLPHARRREVILQRLDDKQRWRNVRRTRVRSNDRFLVRLQTRHSGVLSLRVVIAPRRRARGEAHAGAAPVAKMKVYRPSLATFFGPGLYGNQTACGQLLTPALLGVAHKSLPCGSLVAVLYDGRELVVPVIDRGPYNGAYSWDLTQATADSLGFEQSGTIGYIRVPPARSAR
jgi:hypothetical protein